MTHDQVLTAAAQLADQLTAEPNPWGTVLATIAIFFCLLVALFTAIVWALSRPRRAYRMLMRRLRAARAN